jgi:hypothetical protein
MDRLFLLGDGSLPLLSSSPLDLDDPHSISWHGIGGDCYDSVPANAMDYIDDVSYLNNENFDELGVQRTVELATRVDWYRPDEHYRGWIPTGPEASWPTEWFQDLDTPIAVEQTAGGRWQISEDTLQPIVADLVSFRDALEALAEHPKYDTYVACPALFDLPALHESYDTTREVQIVCSKAKRAVLNHWGVLAWWTASVANWSEGVPEPIIAKITTWNLLSRPKRGFLTSIARDWGDINFGHLIRNCVPLFYLWGIVESHNPRFRRLDPRLMGAYRDACAERDVRSLWGDEIIRMKSEFEECGRFDAFFQWNRDPRTRKCLDAPRMNTTSGRILYTVKDFDTWSRWSLAEDESIEVLDKLYHHVVVENQGNQTTTVVFLCFDRKPKGKMLTENDDFMDDEMVEPCLTEIRERFKGRCAPRTGQFFDPETGIERAKPIDDTDAPAIRRYDEESFLVPPPDGLGGCRLRGVGIQNTHPDTTRLRKSLGPRTSRPGSDHSSEQREEDSSRVMAFEGGWVAAMSRPDHIGNYKRHRPTRRQQHARAPPLSWTPDQVLPLRTKATSKDLVAVLHRRTREEDSPLGYGARRLSDRYRVAQNTCKNCSRGEPIFWMICGNGHHKSLTT